jgi:hypothetical protein
MDDIVRRAMEKWPNVPQVFGWLRLDRRGQWAVKNASGGFDRISNAAVTDFINRNYEHDDAGRWYFQNGPQRVFVTLEYTPWVYRLNDSCDELITHTGRPAGRVDELVVDESGALLVRAEPGAGVVDDRDIAALVAQTFDPGIEALLEGGEGPIDVMLLGQTVTLGTIQSSDVASRFGFDPAPKAAPGTPDC